MGTWGYGIRQNDTVGDVQSEFEEYLKTNPDVAAATEHVKKEYAELLDDEDEAPLFWQALAEMQWTYGTLDPQVLKQVRSDLKSEIQFDLWRAESEADYRKRKSAVEKFITKIEQPRPKPKKMPKVVLRKPLFAAGDCLAIRLSNGQYGAALVTAADDSNPGYGENTVVTLDYLSDKKPTTGDFRRRDWLRLTHHTWDGEINVLRYLALEFSNAKKRIEVVDTIPILKTDPTDSNSIGGWDGVGIQILLQRAWEKEQRGK